MYVCGCVGSKYVYTIGICWIQNIQHGNQTLKQKLCTFPMLGGRNKGTWTGLEVGLQDSNALVVRSWTS